MIGRGPNYPNHFKTVINNNIYTFNEPRLKRDQE